MTPDTPLTADMYDALRRIKTDCHIMADRLRVGGSTLLGLADRGFLSREDARLPAMYSLTERGKGALEILRAVPVPVAYDGPIARIQRETAAQFDTPVVEMTSNSRRRQYAWPRQVAMYLSKLLTSNSLPEIGRRFGHRDHTTVFYAVRKVEKLIAEDPKIHEAVHILQKRLAS